MALVQFSYVHGIIGKYHIQGRGGIMALDRWGGGQSQNDGLENQSLLTTRTCSTNYAIQKICAIITKIIVNACSVSYGSKCTESKRLL